MKRSLYSVGYPAMPDKFYGWRSKVEALFEHIEQGENINIVGLRGSGKSSLLNHVCHLPVRLEYLKTQFEHFKFIHIDLAGISRPDQFVRSVAQRLDEVYGVESLVRLSRTPKLSDLQQALARLKRHTIVIVMDRFDEVFLCGSFDYAFFEGLRALRSGFSQCVLIVATSRSLLSTFHKRPAMLSSSGSPFHNTFRPIYLGALDEADAERLVVDPLQDEYLSLSNEDIYWIRELSGDLPILLQSAAGCLVRARLNSSPAITDYARAHHEFMIWADAQFRGYWQDFQPEERDLLKELAISPEPVELNVHGETHRISAIVELENYGLLRRKDKRHMINTAAFREWIVGYSTHQGETVNATRVAASEGDIAQQNELLASHRKTLYHLLNQEALQGGVTYAIPAIANQIRESRAEIRHIKETLRVWGVSVHDDPEDDAPPGTFTYT